MKAVVLGAGGHIGSAIARALLDRNYHVTACGRRKKPPPSLAGLAIHYAPGDSESLGQFDRWIAGQDLVVDAAAPYPIAAASIAVETANDPIVAAERRTCRLLEAVLRHDARLAYVGSFVTLARPRTGAEYLREQVVRFAHRYFDVKELIESRILDAARHGLRAVLVNPTYCLGPWDLHDRRLCTIPLLLCGEIPASITQMLNVIDVRDVAAALVAAIECERYGAPLLAAGHNISTPDLYGLICKLGGVPAPGLSISAGLALLGAYWMELITGAMSGQPLLPSGGMMMATAFDYLTQSDEMCKIGITPRPLSETIADAITWYRQIGYC